MTSFDGHHLAPERLSLLFHFHLVAFHVAQFALDSLAQLVQLLRLLLELVYLVLLRLSINHSPSTNPVLSVTRPHRSTTYVEAACC